MPYRSTESAFIRRLNILFPGSFVNEHPAERQVTVTHVKRFAPLRGETISKAMLLLNAQSCRAQALSDGDILTFDGVDFVTT